ncbi:MAG: type II toxin-antitoxin system RelE/ParE family toxin [Planctomycetes bacterium]|nr:type II toxin-antitoxin system RelE/ParE family toxin [Planctomycetota bacterium]
MAYKLIWAPSARLDLKEIASYIADSRPEASIRFVKSVFRSVEHLIDFPKAGRIVPEFGDPCIREVVRKPCRIVYRIKSKKSIIEVVRVWHAARGIPRI